MSPTDQLERWTEKDRAMFGNLLVEHGKQFGFIQRIYYPHKTVKNIVEFYYLWKTTVEARPFRLSVKAAQRKQRLQAPFLKPLGPRRRMFYEN
jgi:hypothetical protein